MKNMLKHLAGLMLALLLSCTGGKTIEITVTNPSGVARPAEVVVVDYKALQKAFSGLRLEPDIQISDENGSLLPTQFDDINGDQKWDELVFIADFAANQTRIFRFKQRFLEPDSIIDVTRLWVSLDADLARPMMVDEAHGKQLETELRYAGVTWGTASQPFRLKFDTLNAIDLLPQSSGNLILEQQIDSLAYKNGIVWPPAENPETGGTGGFVFAQNGNLFPPVDLFGFQARILTRGPLRTVVRMDYEDWPVDTLQSKVAWLIMQYHHTPVTEHRLYFKPSASGEMPTVAVGTPGKPLANNPSGVFFSQLDSNALAYFGLVFPPEQHDQSVQILRKITLKPDLSKLPALRYFAIYLQEPPESLQLLVNQLLETQRLPMQISF